MTIEILHLQDPFEVRGQEHILDEAALLIKEAKPKDFSYLEPNSNSDPVHRLFQHGFYADGQQIKSAHYVIVSRNGGDEVGEYFRTHIPDPRDKDNTVIPSRFSRINSDTPVVPIYTKVKNTDTYKIRAILKYSPGSRTSRR